MVDVVSRGDSLHRWFNLNPIADEEMDQQLRLHQISSFTESVFRSGAHKNAMPISSSLEIQPISSFPRPHLPGLLARTRFKASPLNRFSSFGRSKMALSGAFSTPLDVDDTDEQFRGENRSKTSAV